uniref:Uncharacterized protein n=1 Tax=Clytia hemisphaerica TaxID=252671 RepID=A0A7M5TUW3_9CNID
MDFWPIITEEWFIRDRHFPDPETVCEIREVGCLLVRKAIGDEKNTWRLSFSIAETILALKQSPFQKKSYLLAKLIFTLESNGLIDDKSERKLSSYILKTVHLFVLENTPKEELEKLEQTEDYLKLVFIIFERLLDALKVGYLPCYFVLEMNLLHGFGQVFLDNIAHRFDNLFKCDMFIEKMVDNFKKNRMSDFIPEDVLKEISSSS